MGTTCRELALTNTSTYRKSYRKSYRNIYRKYIGKCHTPAQHVGGVGIMGYMGYRAMSKQKDPVLKDWVLKWRLRIKTQSFKKGSCADWS